MYQPYPGGAQMPEPSSRPPVPQSVTRAVYFMYAGAAASLIGIIIDMTMLSTVKSELKSHNPTWTTTQLNNAEHAAIAEFIVVGLIGAAFWIWMAQSCKAGKGWARIVSTVLFALDTIGLVTGAASSGAVGVRVYSVVVWLIGLAAIILLWQRSSSEYFAAGRAAK